MCVHVRVCEMGIMYMQGKGQILPTHTKHSLSQRVRLFRLQVEAKSTSCFVQTRIHRNNLISCFSPVPMILYCTYSSNHRRPYLYILYIVQSFTKIPRDLTREEGKHNWHTSFTHNLHIYLRNNTSQAWQSGTLDPFSRCALVSQWVITRLSWFGLKGGAV